MVISSHFEGIRKIIIDEISQANNEILIAVAWFTNHEIFDALLAKAGSISVQLVVLNDDINNRKEGLNYQKFIKKGGKFYFGAQNQPMNNKFCILDQKVLITGSYNYTYLAEAINHENVVLFKGVNDIIKSYIENFSIIIKDLNPVASISDYLEKNPPVRNLFSRESYGTKDVYQYSGELKAKGDFKEAKAVIRRLESKADQITTDDFVIEDVVYRQWKQDYYVDKIRVVDGEIILHFRTILHSGGGYIHGPLNFYTWTLRNSSNPTEVKRVSRISNIQIGGKSKVKELTGEVILHMFNGGDQKFDENQGYLLSKEGIPINQNGVAVRVEVIKITEKAEIKCELHFDARSFINKTVDLIEGIGAEEFENHWHCFDINLKLNRKPI